MKSLVFLGLSFLIYYIMQTWNMKNSHMNYQVDLSIKWSTFIRDCGKRVPLETAMQRYTNHYLNKYVQWEGHVMRIDGNELNFIHQATILLVMDPRDVHMEDSSYGNREPDLILSFDLNSFTKNREVIEDLRKGDLIKFNATLTHFSIKRASSDS